MENEFIENALKEAKDKIFALVANGSKEAEILLKFSDHVNEAINCIMQLPPQLQLQVAHVIKTVLAPNDI